MRSSKSLGDFLVVPKSPPTSALVHIYSLPIMRSAGQNSKCMYNIWFICMVYQWYVCGQCIYTLYSILYFHSPKSLPSRSHTRIPQMRLVLSLLWITLGGNKILYQDHTAWLFWKVLISTTTTNKYHLASHGGKETSCGSKWFLRFIGDFTKPELHFFV